MRRKINSIIKEYAAVENITVSIVDEIIERIEVGHITRKSKPGNVIHIQWKLK